MVQPRWDEAAWPEGRPPTGAELDRASYGGVVYAPRVDGHSAVVSSALAAASGARLRPGWMGEGLVIGEAHHVAREAFNDSVTPGQRRADIELALQAAAAAGIGLVHENGGPVTSSAAFRAHTVGGWAAARVDRGARIEVGAPAPATFAVWDVAGPGLPDLAGGATAPRATRTVVHGRTVHDLAPH